MELVLSPGGGAGDAGSPFRNEDVREWSRVDRITGMLERARVETDRWQADTRDAKQSYGKVTDSRQRNSADGSLVQKARRQVEVFQSQGNGGRNIQVVRASQWSSSRATDCTLGLHNSNQPNNNYVEADCTMNNGEPFGSPRLQSLWRPSLAETAASDLDRLSDLCRKLHHEAMSNASFWPLDSPFSQNNHHITASPTTVQSFGELDNDVEVTDERLSLTDRRSNSNDDLPSLTANGDEGFARDCKTRRSLQITNNSLENDEDNSEIKARRSRAELIAERAKRFEDSGDFKDNGTKKNFISTKTFTPIANNDFVKNDPMHPSKFNQVAKISIQDNPSTTQNGHHHHHHHTVTSTSRKANNRTVVHLRNAASPDAQSAPPPRCINVTAIKLEKDNEDEAEEENNRPIEQSPTTTTTTTTTTLQANGVKPVKKVEFCKTEIHFAADSGKVNIVETDGKPPPTNKFRRRRRNHSLNSAIGTNPQKSNLPVVHFGDTSYEKYIFGGGKVPPPAAQENENKTDNNSAVATLATAAVTNDEINKNNIESNGNTRWDNGTNNKEMTTTRDSFTDTSLDKVLEHVSKFRGAHTTTVNFLSDESKALVKLDEGTESTATTRGIRLQFASRSLSPIHSSINSDDEASGNEERVIRTTKITLHLPAPNIHHPPLTNPFSNLKSVQLVMNMMTASQLIDSFCKANSNNVASCKDSEQLWSLKLRDCQDDARILDESRMIEDKPCSTFIQTPSGSSSTKNQLPSKDNLEQVQMKVVTTHKPVVARVDEHPPAKPSRLKNQTDEEKVKSHQIEEVTHQVQAKEHCDKETNDVDEQPVYENIFDAVSSNETPLYENFHQVVKTIVPVVEKPEEKLQVVKKPLATRKVPAKINNEALSNKVMRSSTPKSEKERSSSRSRDGSIKRRKDGKFGKEDTARTSLTKRSSSSLQERKATPTNLVTDKNAVKAKKPVEVVYKTAIYNMKNEKLSKPSKSKEMKGPRLINELICGTKLKKPSDSRKMIKTAMVSQSNGKKKETPTPVMVNR